jgi:hypothetical protein
LGDNTAAQETNVNGGGSMTIQRKIIESPLKQGMDEQIVYTLTTTPWGSSPSNVTVVLKDSDGTDVSGTKLSGSVSVNGDVITTPKVIGLAAGEKYRLEIKFTVSGNIVEAWAEIWGEE